MTDPLGQSQVIPYLVGLSKQGFHFHLVSFEKKEQFRKEHDHISKLLKANDIEWHPLSYTKKPPVISTMRDLGRMKQHGLDIIQKHPVRLIHCRSYISALAGLDLSKQKGIPFIFDMRGFYADERVDGGLWNLSNPIYKAVYNYFKKKEKELLATADAVVSLTENGRREIESWKLRPSKKDPIRVIPCCADLEHFNPGVLDVTSRNKLREKLHLMSANPVLSYLGAIGTWYLLDDMLDFFKVFLNKYPDAVFLFITHDREKKIHDAATTKGIPLSSIRVYAARRNEVPVALSLSNASVFFIKPVFSKMASSPTKQGEIMGMGLPLICNSGIGDTDAVVSKYGSGITIDLNQPGAYENAVNQYAVLMQIPREQIISGAEDFFSLRTGVEKYKEIYLRLAKR